MSLMSTAEKRNIHFNNIKYLLLITQFKEKIPVK